MPQGLVLGIPSEEPFFAPVMLAAPVLRYSVSPGAAGLEQTPERPSSFLFADGSSFHTFVESRQYATELRIGTGSFGTAYKFTRGETYILKTFPTKLISEDVDNEVRALIALHGSPYVVQLLAAEVYTSNAFLLFPYVEGLLFNEWRDKGPSVEEFRRVYADLLTGIEFIHSRGLLHRDIKPDNVWVPADTSKPPFYLDLGLAVPIGTVTESRGARAYKRNENIGDRVQTTNVNLFALGKMIAERPAGGTRRHKRQRRRRTLRRH